MNHKKWLLYWEPFLFVVSSTFSKAFVANKKTTKGFEKVGYK
jgi:hypothetical protein